MTAQIILFAYCIDPGLGRFDSASLPQQALMEIFVDGITNREKICASTEEPEDIEDWKGVILNENGEVIVINWGWFDLEGTLNLEWLPSTVQEVSMYENNLKGSIHLETLPPSMKMVLLSDNKFSGEISLKHLPEGLTFLDLGINKLSGTINLTKLPAGLQKLYLRDNNFLGETDFSKLPESLKGLTVSNTQLSGEIHLKTKKPGFKVDNSNVKIVISESQS